MRRPQSSEVLRAFGRRLRELREAHGLTQEELALKARIDRSYVGQVERGTRNVALINIHKLANALGVSPHELLMPLGAEQSLTGEDRGVPHGRAN